MPTPDHFDPRTTLTARTLWRRSGPVHVVTTLPAVRAPVAGSAPVRSVGHADGPRGWTVRVSAGPVQVCAYPDLPLWSAWALARSARRCWPDWQANLSRADSAPPAKTVSPGTSLHPEPGRHPMSVTANEGHPR
jgi:hypothetical protein